MSGLEPIAALSVACNILQIVGAGLETVRIAREVYQNGELDPALLTNATTLNSLSKSLPSINRSASTARLKPQEKQLFELAEKCKDAARDLQEEVKFLGGPPTKAKLMAALKVAAKTTWRKKRLDRLDQRLNDAERRLQTGLLATLYERSVKADHDLSSLDTNLRAFIEEYRKGHITTIDVTKKHVSQESRRNEVAIKDHVTQIAHQTALSVRSHIDTTMRGVMNHREDTISEATRDKLLRSLKFDRMNERRNQVSSSHPKTCTWILQDGSEKHPSGSESDDDEESSLDDPESLHDEHPWDSFSDWLRSTESIYWISGKPGSGKSTIMRYVVSQMKTKENLNVWKSDPIIVSHYFWRPGTPMQQSIKGLMCSLLHQLLFENHSVTKSVLRCNKDIAQKDADTDWSEDELQRAIEEVILNYDKPIAVFLDGLDEVLPKDGVQKLLRAVERLKELGETASNIKICLASRPEPLLFKYLTGYSKLQLENLNYKDLLKYAQDIIRVPDDYSMAIHATSNLDLIPCYSRQWPPSPSELKRWLVESLVKKAEGVFLWLYLTATMLQKALDEDETVEDLDSRLKHLSGDLEDLYTDMWARANNDGDSHRRRAASYLQLALAANVERSPAHWVSITPFAMMIATTPEIADVFVHRDLPQHDSAIPFIKSLIGACEATKRDVLHRCAGLLTSSTPPANSSSIRIDYLAWYGEQYKAVLPYNLLESQYRFVHRTARDFLEDTEVGRRILGWGSFSGVFSQLQLIENRLAACQLFRISFWDIPSNSTIQFDPSSAIHMTYAMQWDSEWLVEDFVKERFLQLMHLYERLFDRGLLTNDIKTAPRGVELKQVSRGPIPTYTTYEATVNRQHEFIITVAQHSTLKPRILCYLVPFLRGRSLDEGTLSQILLYACSFSFPRDKNKPLVSNSRLDLIKTLLDRGALPGSKALRRSTAYDPQCLISSLETPFRALIMSFWGVFIRSGFDESYHQMFLKYIPLFLTDATNMQEEIHTVIAIDNKFMGFHRFEPGYTAVDFCVREGTDYRKNEDIIALLMVYPASAILATMFQKSQSTELFPADRQSEPWGMGQTILGQGRIVAAADLRECSKFPNHWQPLELFCVADIYPLSQANSRETGLERLVRFTEKSLEAKYASAFDDQAVPSEAPELSDIREEVICAIERMSVTEVPIEERRRQLRLSLDICTPLEEPDWQMEESKYFPE